VQLLGEQSDNLRLIGKFLLQGFSYLVVRDEVIGQLVFELGQFVLILADVLVVLG
jgi:hypothetical protein